MPTVEQQYAMALERTAFSAKLLLDRLAAMEQSGVLSQVAKDSVADWVTRVEQSFGATPPKPASLIPQEN